MKSAAISPLLQDLLYSDSQGLSKLGAKVDPFNRLANKLNFY